MWTLPANDENEQLPLYKQVIVLIEEIIENGSLEGARLPSERKLCQLLGLSRSTVVQALNELEERGVLMRRQGSGTYINKGKWGLQHYPILNWKAPTASRGGKDSEKIQSLLEKYENIFKKKKKSMLDLSESNLPSSLYPAKSIPKVSWQKVLQQEMGSEASFSGLSSLKKVVQKDLAMNLDLRVDSDEILISSGAQQSLFLISQCLLQPGDAIGIEIPSYFYSLPVFQAAGLRLFAIDMDEEGITLDSLEDISSRFNLKMIFLNPIFQNPSGSVMSQQRKKDVFNFCSIRQIPIVEDDSYSGLAFNRKVNLTPIKCLDLHGRVLYIGSLSSYLGRNIRIGWLVAPKSVVLKMAEVRSQMDAGLSVLPQVMAKHYLETLSENHRAFIREKLSERAVLFIEWLENKFPDSFDYIEPRGGFHIYLRPKEERGLEHFEALLKEGIIAGRGSDFGDSGQSLRINFAHFDREVLG